MASGKRILFSLGVVVALGVARQTTGAQPLQVLRPVGGAELTVDGIANVSTSERANLHSLLPIGEQPPVVAYEPDADGIVFTGLDTDLAIRGAGWFAVKDVSSGQILYTRRGDFRIDSNGYLITSQGYRLQGASLYGSQSVADLLIDLRFTPPETDPTATIVRLNFLPTGEIQLGLSDGSKYFRAQILLQYFGAVENLYRIDGFLFGRTAMALPAAALAAPGTSGLGLIVSQSLEVLPLAPKLVALEQEDESPLLRGGMTRTGNLTDLAIRGPGAFVVRDPLTSELFATRAGMFLVDSNGYLITYDRKRLQGYSEATNNRLGDLTIYAPPPPTTDPQATFVRFHVSRVGSIVPSYSDGTEHVAGTIALYDFRRPERLRPNRLGQFAGVLSAQPVPLKSIGSFGEEATQLEQGALELINVTPDLLSLRRRQSFFTQGALYRTESPTDLAVDGEGFFLLHDPATGRPYATRNGQFRRDADGYLVSGPGHRLLGWPDAASEAVDYLQIPDAQFQIRRDGLIVAQPGNGPEAIRGQVLLASFNESFQLRPLRNGLYDNLAAAQLRAFAAPGTLGLGSIESYALEVPAEPEKLVLPSRDGFRFLITGNASVRWKVMASQEQRNWRMIGIIEPASGEIEFCDRGGRMYQTRYYRVIAEYLEPQFNRPDLQMSNVLTNAPDWERCVPRKPRR